MNGLWFRHLIRIGSLPFSALNTFGNSLNHAVAVDLIAHTDCSIQGILRPAGHKLRSPDRRQQGTHIPARLFMLQEHRDMFITLVHFVCLNVRRRRQESSVCFCSRF